MIESVQSFTEYWVHARARTTRVLEHLPEADIEWTYGPGHFTFGDLFRHLAAMERFMYAETVQGHPNAYPGHSQALASGVAAVRAYVERCHAESLAIFRALSESDLRRKCLTPSGAPITTWKWLRAMAEHEAHHRGQLYLMASMRGITIPPLYGLTEEQVLERAEAGTAGAV